MNLFYLKNERQRFSCSLILMYCFASVLGLPSPKNWLSHEVNYDVLSPIAAIGLESGSEQVSLNPREDILHNAKPTIGKELVDTNTLCLEPGCVHAASKMLEKMNLTVNPCDDFFEFACGKFVKETLIPDDKTAMNTFGLMRDRLQEQLRILLEEPIDDAEIRPFTQTKQFYKVCMNQSLIEEKGEKRLLNILKELGGFPLLMSNEFDEESYSWVETIKKFRQKGITVDYLIDFTVSLDQTNSSMRIIEIDQPNFQLSREYLIKGRNDSNVKAFYEYMRDISIALGADEKSAATEMSDMVDFEIALANITTAREIRRNATLLYNPTKLKDLQEKYSYLDWFGYISAILPPEMAVDENEIVSVVDVQYFDRLGDLLKATPKRTIANYLLGRVYSGSIRFLTTKLRKRQLEYFKVVYGQSEEEPRWKECTQITLAKLPTALSAMFVRRYFKMEAKRIAQTMVDDIKKEFENIIKTVDWMDAQTRVEAMKKLDAMGRLIGYPDELNSDETMLDYFKDLNLVEDDLLESIFKITIFLSDKSYRKLREPVVKDDWKTWTKAAQVNAFYNRIYNHIKFPAGILQGHFFSADRPQYLNYGAIGSVIGHEITHGFDDQGSQFNGDGNLKDWWDPETKESFKIKAKCIIKQYNETFVEQANQYLNGVATQGENIADNGGVKEAYYAYQRYVERNGPEKLLPGLVYTQQQLFWVSMSQNWCSKYRDEAIKVAIIQHNHPPSKYRVLLPLQNSVEFSKDFQCPQGSPMNPAHKCQVW